VALAISQGSDSKLAAGALHDERPNVSTADDSQNEALGSAMRFLMAGISQLIGSVLYFTLSARQFPPPFVGCVVLISCVPAWLVAYSLIGRLPPQQGALGPLSLGATIRGALSWQRTVLQMVAEATKARLGPLFIALSIVLASALLAQFLFGLVVRRGLALESRSNIVTGAAVFGYPVLIFISYILSACAAHVSGAIFSKEPTKVVSILKVVWVACIGGGLLPTWGALVTDSLSWGWWVFCLLGFVMVSVARGVLTPLTRITAAGVAKDLSTQGLDQTLSFLNICTSVPVAIFLCVASFGLLPEASVAACGRELWVINIFTLASGGVGLFYICRSAATTQKQFDNSM
jgi:hypothetical protein